MWNLLIIFSVINAERGVLLDTSDTTSDLVTGERNGWKKPPYSMWNDVTSHDEEYNTIRVLQVCNPKARVQKDSWVISPFIPHQNSTLVFLEVKYRIRSCATIKSTTCNESFDVMVNMADGPDGMAPTESGAWKQVGRMSGIATKTVEIGPINRKGFFVAFKDFGSCSEVLHTRIYYNYCAPIVSGLASYPSVPTTNVDQRQRGKCTPNSQPVSPSQDAESICTPSGEWKALNTRCVCNEGYEHNDEHTSCLACSPGTYKPKPGAQKCLVCPLNSYSTIVGSITCPCKETYYRAPSDHHTKLCTEAPSAPISVEYRVNQTTVELWWRRPNSSGKRNDLTYRIECSWCDEDGRRCGPCGSDVRFTPKPDDIRPEDRNNAQISNLAPNTNYNIKVYALNGVSGVAEEHGQMPKYAEAKFRTESPSQYKPGPEIVGSVKVVKSDAKTAHVSWSKSSSSVNNYELRYFDSTDIQYENVITISEEYVLEKLAPDTEYTVQVRARSNSGTGPWSIKEVFRTSIFEKDGVEIGPYQTESKGFNWIAAVILSALLLALLLFVVAFLFIKRHSRNWTKGSRTSYYHTSTGPAGTIDASVDLIPCEMKREYVEPRMDAYSDFCNELDPNQIHIEQMLAQSDFGEVCRGIYNGRVVTVKSLKSTGTNTELLREASIMSQFDHVNVIKLEGIVTRVRPNMIVTEFAHNGDLLSFLRNNRPQVDIIARAMLDIANGMKYLHSKRYVHQNLQAKNVFITLDQTAKIGNFSNLGDNSAMDSYSGYSTLSNTEICLRWTAPESIKTKVFSFSSDVWSFGVVMWESFSLGDQPYWGLSDREVFDAIESGWRLPTPKTCPDQFHQVMLQCWTGDPSKRPFFPFIIQQVENLLIEMSQMPKSVAV